MKKRQLTRRAFLSRTAAAAATVTILPRYAFAGPNDKLNMACVGVGGKGAGDVGGVSSEHIFALCDVDFKNGKGSFDRHPQAKRYRDFRYMFSEMGDKIDAVTVSTPDHMHFAIAAMAMKMGKHVFVQKPLSRTVWEAREMQRLAKETGVATQMGNQGHASHGTRLVYEWIRSGSIGAVKEVHFWTDRPIWPQGIPHPTDKRIAPPTLDWNLWVGTSQYRDYHDAYAPFRWRGWWDYGAGALGDIGCHVMDAAFWALDLRAPDWIEAESDAPDADTTPKQSIVTYHFPARGEMPPVIIKWHDGKRRPPRPKDLGPDRKMGGNGAVIIGETASIWHDFYCGSCRIIPEAMMKKIGRPKKMVERVKGGHYQEWIRACKGGAPAGSNIVDHSGPLTEMVVLGNLAVRARKRIYWDAKNLRVTGAPEANAFIRDPFRVF